MYILMLSKYTRVGHVLNSVVLYGQRLAFKILSDQSYLYMNKKLNYYTCLQLSLYNNSCPIEQVLKFTVNEPNIMTLNADVES